MGIEPTTSSLGRRRAASGRSRTVKERRGHARTCQRLLRNSRGRFASAIWTAEGICGANSWHQVGTRRLLRIRRRAGSECRRAVPGSPLVLVAAATPIPADALVRTLIMFRFRGHEVRRDGRSAGVTIVPRDFDPFDAPANSLSWFDHYWVPCRSYCSATRGRPPSRSSCRRRGCRGARRPAMSCGASTGCWCERRSNASTPRADRSWTSRRCGTPSDRGCRGAGSGWCWCSG